MSAIVLSTLNARYWHSSFGLRYLMANLEELAAQSVMLEFGIKDQLSDVLESILQERPKIVGFGVYIWNLEPTTRLVTDLKRLAPEIKIVLGGPEVSYEADNLDICEHADYIISGEADFAFPNLCREILNAEESSPKWIAAGVPELSKVQLPYELYTEEDILQRVIYVEASRGCPFTCEFCLSALDIPVRQFDIDEFLAAMQKLHNQGVRQFKFVDRTFNLNMRVSRAILEFFLERMSDDLFLHFEMIPDRLPDSLRDLIVRFPPGSLQFEVGVQTFNDTVGQYISRRQNNQLLEDNFRFLRNQTGVHIHADLIVGLPGESLESFGTGFNRLVRLDPQEIQVGMLKRLRGTPITRHDDEWQMIYQSAPPYEILSNRLISFETMQRMRRFAKYWDLIANSGNFRQSRDLIWENRDSEFDAFLNFSDWLYSRESQSHGIPLTRLAEQLFRFLVDVEGLDEEMVARSIWDDYTSGGREDRPRFLKKFDLPNPQTRSNRQSKLPQRQAKHTPQAERTS
ncbi:coproporphyrinogen III oxidase [Thalassoglobus neptunius]|uniref:Coproporphyrinogen III oxidase n=1 Tax=Thalassoglobus neptunius TaxID=1938619 RepID=A0A5C5W9T1_9PLAN|nr:B12-binding domain-containing radical SAM protein [Thalassoglobus neptunius]TWT47043.1 coproporphyrinogen III oxidase [Thalassoglobus neptunius]